MAKKQKQKRKRAKKQLLPQQRRPVVVPPDARELVDAPEPITPPVETLTAKERRFVEEYCIDLNASGAARRAGYSKKTSAAIGYELLRKPFVAAAIAQWKTQMSARASLSKADVEAEFERMGGANLLNYFYIDDSGQPHIDLTGITREHAAALTEITVDDFVDGRGDDKRDVKRVRIKMADKLQALMNLARLRGWVVDRGEVKIEDVTKREAERKARTLSEDEIRALRARSDAYLKDVEKVVGG